MVLEINVKMKTIECITYSYHIFAKLAGQPVSKQTPRGNRREIAMPGQQLRPIKRKVQQEAKVFSISIYSLVVENHFPVLLSKRGKKSHL